MTIRVVLADDQALVRGGFRVDQDTEAMIIFFTHHQSS